MDQILFSTKKQQDFLAQVHHSIPNTKNHIYTPIPDARSLAGGRIVLLFWVADATLWSVRISDHTFMGKTLLRVHTTPYRPSRHLSRSSYQPNVERSPARLIYGRVSGPQRLKFALPLLLHVYQSKLFRDGHCSWAIRR